MGQVVVQGNDGLRRLEHVRQPVGRALRTRPEHAAERVLRPGGQCRACRFGPGAERRPAVRRQLPDGA